MSNLVTLRTPVVTVDSSNESIPHSAMIDNNRVVLFNKVINKTQEIYYPDKIPTNVDLKLDGEKRLISAIGYIVDNVPTLELRYPEALGSCVLKRFNNITEFKLKVFDDVVFLFYRNYPDNALAYYRSDEYFETSRNCGQLLMNQTMGEITLDMGQITMAVNRL